MNISYRWLSEYAANLPDSAETLADQLALAGFPVEEMHSFTAGLGDIVVARVIEAVPHPDADRLRVCRVDAGTGEELQVVCGAPNARSGGVFPFIPVGGVLPDGMKIRKAKIRGQTSFGMLCSARELGLGTDHNGLLDLSGEYEPGASFLEALGLNDVRMDVEITANRGDLLCHIGMAREVGSNVTELPALPGVDPVSFDLASDPANLSVGGVDFFNQEPELCGRFLGAIVRGVKVGPSPDWLQARLRAIGARPINNVVDATNYVLFELGQPTHAYDLEQLKGGKIGVRMAREDEKVTTLDEEKRTLTAQMLVIADAERTVDVAGIMGEDETSVSDETTDLLLECAHFDAASIRNTKKALGIVSDAGYRFERFVDPTGQERAIARVLSLILAHAGGELHPVVADLNSRPWTPPVIALRESRVEHLLGIPFAEARIRELLEPLGFECAAAADGIIDVTVPGWRGADVTREVDLIEEIARRHGYDNFPTDLGVFRPGTVPDHPLFQLEDRLRGVMAGLGAFEAQTPAFAPETEGEVRLSNPLSKEEPVLRRELLPSLLRRIEYNLARGARDLRFYEFGTSFRSGGEGGLPLEEARMTLALHGGRAPGHWSSDNPQLDIWDLKGWMESLADLVWPGSVVIPGHDMAVPVNPHASFVIQAADGSNVGCGGAVLDGAVDTPPWAGTVFGIELRLPAEPSINEELRVRALPSHPGVERDLALLVPHGVAATELQAIGMEAGGRLVEAVSVFDLYEGEGVPDGHRSLALRFRFQAPDRTLTDEEVEKSLRKVLERFREEKGVEVRRG